MDNLSRSISKSVRLDGLTLKSNMKSNLFIPLAFLFVVTACRVETPPAAPPSPFAAPTAAAPAFRTEIPVVTTRTDRVAPTLAPITQTTLAPTETLSPTTAPTQTAQPTLAPTNIPPTLATGFTATPQLAPAVYVTQIKITPPQPKNKPAEFFFTVSFLNTVGENVNYPRWRVLLFPKGQNNSIGDPEGLSKTIAPGASTQDTKPWSIRVTSACENFVAQPIWQGEDGSRKILFQPDGKPLTLEFQICP